MSQQYSVVLPKSPSSDVMKSLIRANHFLNHARDHSSKHNDFDLMIAIHNVDNACEYLLRIIAMHIEYDYYKGKAISEKIHEMFKDINDYLPLFTNLSTWTLPLRTEILAIRKMRNMVQHSMANPVSEVQKYLTYATDFFEQCLQNFFGLSIVQLQISTIIRNANLKRYLMNAESSIANHDYLRAVIDCRNAFEHAYFTYCYDTETVFNLPGLAALTADSFEIGFFVKSLNRKTQLILYGVDYPKYVQFMDFVRHIPCDYNADKSGGNSVLQREWQRDDALFCYRFASDTILNWELSQVEPMIRPPIDLGFISEDTDTEKFNGIGVENLYGERSLVHFNADIDCITRVFYVTEKTVNLFRTMKNGLALYERYLYKTKLSSSFIYINYIFVDEVLNEPPTWAVTINYEIIPFAELYEQGGIDIDTADIAQMQEAKVPDSVVAEITRYREQNKPLISIEDAEALYLKIKCTSKLYSSKLFQSLTESIAQNSTADQK